MHVEPGSELDRALEEVAGTEVLLEKDGVHYRVTRLDRPQGSPWLKELYEYFAPVRQEIVERGVPEEELNADIDAAIAAARAKRRTRRS